MAQFGNNFAVSVIVIGPGNKTILVKDEMKPTPHYWKFPGGKSEPGEDPAEAAIREMREETGVDIDPSDLTLLIEEPRGNHVMYLFAAKLQGFGRQKPRGDEGEIVEEFDLDEVLTMVDFFPPHRKLLENGLAQLRVAS